MSWTTRGTSDAKSCELTDQEIENILQRHRPHFIKHFPKGIRINRTDCGLGVFTTRKLKTDHKVGHVRGYIKTLRWNVLSP
ncbi:MAG: hypothetical protein LBJ67_03490 [Planctomycetaceae bacterium]|nr:hypothetical protein [Planctomycetaceae bacterium]